MTVWLILTAAGLALTAAAVYGGAMLGTRSAPFLGSYRWQLIPSSALAPAVALVVVIAAARGWQERMRWSLLYLAAYLAFVSWALALALTDGTSGLIKGVTSPDEYLVDLDSIGDHPATFLSSFTALAPEHSAATRGHPPGPVLLLWALGRAGLTSHLGLGLLITALGGLAVPLILSTIRDICGDVPARRYAPVLCLAPYAIWSAVSMDAIVAVLAAALIAAGVRASGKRSHGWTAAGWAALAGLLTGIAALFSYAAPWLGLSLVCLYFARRRAFLNVVTGLLALLPVLVVQVGGFTWADGLRAAEADYTIRIEPYRSAVWWGGISLVVLLLAAGPTLVASARKLRNTPAWPCLVGAFAAVVFSVLAGLARGGVEHAWLPFFPWLTVAAIAPERQGGDPAQTPVVLVALGAATAIVIEAVLASPW